jgi:hypothetical protein
MRDEIGSIKVGRRLPNIKLFWRSGRTAGRGSQASGHEGNSCRHESAARGEDCRHEHAKSAGPRKPQADKTGAADRLVSGPSSSRRHSRNRRARHTLDRLMDTDSGCPVRV